MKNGKLIVVSGPSGVGKSTICKKLIKILNAFLSVSVTTRPVGEGEVNGEHYKFISVEEFEKGIKEEAFLEYAEVFGNYYGTPWEPVDEALEKGRTIILEIDVQGGLKVKKVYPKATLIFLLPPHINDLHNRIDSRGRGEDKETKKRRIESASQETAKAWQHYDHMVINDDIETTVKEIIGILDSN